MKKIIIGVEIFYQINPAKQKKEIVLMVKLNSINLKNSQCPGEWAILIII